MAVTWISTFLITVAIGGIVGGQIYLRLRLRSASQHRSVEQLVLIFAVAAMLGYGLVTIGCLSSGQCLMPTRDVDLNIASMRQNGRSHAIAP